MKLEPPNLEVPLRKKKLSCLWFIFVCIVLAALALRASSLSHWLTAIFVLGPAFWVALGGPHFVYQSQFVSAPLMRGVAYVLRIGFAFVVFSYVSPMAVKFLNGALDF
jgi:hypothetical protein